MLDRATGRRVGAVPFAALLALGLGAVGLEMLRATARRPTRLWAASRGALLGLLGVFALTGVAEPQALWLDREDRDVVVFEVYEPWGGVRQWLDEDLGDAMPFVSGMRLERRPRPAAAHGAPRDGLPPPSTAGRSSATSGP